MNQFAEAIRLHQQGQQYEARELCLKILQRDPGNAQVLTLHGTVNALLGRREEAIASFERASARLPKYAPAHYMLGNLYRDEGRLEQAVNRFRKAIACQPNFADAYNNLGLTLGVLGRRDEEIDCYRLSVRANPHHHLAWYNLGNTLQLMQQFDEAVACYEHVLQLAPGDINALFNMGNALLASGRLTTAIASYQKVIEQNPNHVPALGNLGVALKRIGNFHEAIDVLSRIAAWEPGNTTALLSLANAQAELGHVAAALATLQRVTQLAPEHADAFFNMGNLLHRGRQYFDAAVALQRACALQPGNLQYLGSLISCWMAQWQMPAADDAWSLLMAQWGEGKRIPLDVVLERSDDLVMVRQCAQQYVQEWLRDHDPAGQYPFMHTQREIRSVKYRIGYLSPDFGDHPVGMSVVEVFERHDRMQFEIIALSLKEHPNGSVRNRIAQSCDRFISLDGLSLNQLIDCVRELDLDLLIDLAGYTANSQPLLPAARLAPVQATYLGYAGTTASPWTDYLIADEHVVPESSANEYSESIAWLDTCFFPTDTLVVPTPNADRAKEGLPIDAFVFCCFNNARRITSEMMQLWMELLGEVGDSVLWLGNASEIVANNLCEFAVRNGIEPTRLVFARFANTREEHLSRHRLADLYLDTFPYNSHSTARDALYMGLPLLTLSGRSFASRVAGSLLTSLGVTRLIASSPHEYKWRAIELARHPESLRNVREQLANAKLNMPLFKTAVLVSSLERAYLTMIKRQRAGMPPFSFKLDYQGVH